MRNMGEVIKFPINQKPVSAEVFKVGNSPIKSCLFKGAPQLVIGGEVVIEVSGKKHKGIVTAILQKDINNNVTKITYTIPFLDGDDPLKFGEADFTYDIKTYD